MKLLGELILNMAAAAAWQACIKARIVQIEHVLAASDLDRAATSYDVVV